MKKIYKLALSVATIIATGFNSFSQTTIYSEGFEGSTFPPTNWAMQNNSIPVGTNPTWTIGVSSVFAANTGTSYASTNFNNTTGTNAISNFLITPTLSLVNGNVVRFFTRTTTGSFPDRLQVLLSTAGTNTSVGTGTTLASVGVFSTTLLDINPNLTTLTNSAVSSGSVNGYPIVWTAYDLTLTAIPTPTVGRIAFRYYVTNAGPSGANSDYIGIDDFSYICPAAGNPTVAVNNATICGSGSVVITPTVTGISPFTYSWSNTSTLSAITVTTGGLNTVTVTAGNGCRNLATSATTINSIPVVSIAGNSVICAGQTSTFTASGAGSFAWNTGATTNSVVLSPTTTTNYTVVGTLLSCTASATRTLIVNPIPVVNISGLSSICSGATSTLTASGAATYSWNTGSTSNSIAVSPSVNTTYTATGTSSFGCVGTGVVTVTVNAIPTISVNSGAICTGSSFTITPSGASTYTISGGSAVVTPTSNSTYSVTGTSAAGCLGSNTALSSVTVNALPSLTLTASASTVCVNGSTIVLTPNPAGGVLTGTNVSGGVFTPGAVAGTFTPIYSFTNSTTGCSNTTSTTIVVVNCTGVKNNSNVSLSVQPNPTSGIFNVVLSNGLSNLFQVSDISGKVVAEIASDLDTTPINISNLANGVYYLKIVGKAEYGVYKIVKQ